MTIEDRIGRYKAEQAALNATHESMVEQNKKMNEQFQQSVLKNQHRFYQTVGAIEVLEELLKEENNGN